MNISLTAETLEALPTLHSGHTGNLKIETEELRVWVERGWRDYPPGECRPVTVERLIGGRWVDVTDDEEV